MCCHWLFASIWRKKNMMQKIIGMEKGTVTYYRATGATWYRKFFGNSHLFLCCFLPRTFRIMEFPGRCLGFVPQQTSHTLVKDQARQMHRIRNPSWCIEYGILTGMDENTVHEQWVKFSLIIVQLGKYLNTCKYQKWCFEEYVSL